MPVKIYSNEGSEPKTRALTLEQFNEGKENFNKHYRCTLGEYNGRKITITWEQLSSVVENYINTHGVPAEDVAVRFVHCFENLEPMPLLYMRMQLLKMQPTNITDFGRPVHTLIHEDGDAWYRLTDNQLEECVEKTLIDLEYMNHFEYRPVETTEEYQILSEGPREKYVKSITFPWLTEIYAMYHENGDPVNASINFEACSFIGLDKGDSAVEWPHGLGMYLTDEHGEDMLNDDNTMVLFYYKGADMGTCCPPKCGSYIVAPVVVLPE